MHISPAERPTILVVDDSTSAVKMLTSILTQEYSVSVISDGYAVVDAVRIIQPTLILLDMVMPGLDGYEILQRLKADESTLHIPVIFVTSNARGSDETRGLDAGAVDYITKPFDPIIITTRIRHHVKSALYKKTIQELLLHNQMILNAAGEGIYGLNAQGLISFVNPTACTMLGWTAEELLGQNAHDLFHHTRSSGKPYPHTECPTYAAIRDGTVTRDNKDLFWRKDGTAFPVAFVSTPIQTLDTVLSPGHGDHLGAVVVFRDISQQKQLEDREARSQVSRIAISALLETSLESLSLQRQLHIALHIILSVSWLSLEYKGSIFLVDNDTQTLTIVAQLGLPEVLQERCANIPFGHCLCGKAAESQQVIFRNALDNDHNVHFEGIHQHGHYCVPIFAQKKLIGVLNLYIPHEHVRDPEEDAFVVTIANTLAGIIVRRKLEEKLEQSRKDLDHQARHDRLTGLPNRMLFHERLQQNLLRARRDRTMVAVLFIDLDRFKYVNDTFGHETGDQLLVQVSQAIQSLLRQVDTVARMGGDEFTVILSGIAHETDATRVADKIIALLLKPFLILGNACEIGASIGISLFPEHGTDAETLLKKADAAMYNVKEQGRNNYRLYQPGMDK